MMIRSACCCSPGPLSFFQFLGHEPGDFFEAGDVFGIDPRQDVVRLQADAGQFFAAGIDGLARMDFRPFRHDQRHFREFEEMNHAEALEELANPRVGVR